jgi:hypothetical protein
LFFSENKFYFVKFIFLLVCLDLGFCPGRFYSFVFWFFSFWRAERADVLFFFGWCFSDMFFFLSARLRRAVAEWWRWRAGVVILWWRLSAVFRRSRIF